MKTEIINITPQLAAEWLKFNTDNRPLRRTVVNGFKDAIKRGEYMSTHQGIAFADDGTLLDGQHRLTAISELRDGIFPMLVTRDINRDAFRVMDIGIKRTAADALHEDRRLVETARLIAILCDTSRSSITPTMLLPIIEEIQDTHTDLLLFAPRMVKTWASAPVRCAAITQILSGIDTDYVKLIYRALVNAEFDVMPKVAQSLVRAQLAGTVRASAAADMFARCLIVFDPSRQNQTKIQIKDTRAAIGQLRAIMTRALIKQKNAAPDEAATKSASASNYSRVARRKG